MDTLNTPYAKIQKLLQLKILKGTKSIVDMGSGIGRLGLLIGSNFPQINFTGYEYLKHRTAAAIKTKEKLNLDNVNFINADFTDSKLKLAEADVYFTYWSNADNNVMKSMFNKIGDVASKKRIIVVARGILKEAMQEYAPWLKVIEKPFDDIVIYESTLHSP